MSLISISSWSAIRMVSYTTPPIHPILAPLYGTAQQAILEGATPYTSNETGPMGSDHSAYAPIQDAQGNLLGFVIVGIYMRSMAQTTVQTILQFVAIGLLAVLLGSLLALRLSRRIKQSLHGYEPDAFAQRFNLREDILGGTGRGHTCN